MKSGEGEAKLTGKRSIRPKRDVGQAKVGGPKACLKVDTNLLEMHMMILTEYSQTILLIYTR